jgi:hypothetical protein
MLVSCLVYSLILKVEATCSSKISVDFNELHGVISQEIFITTPVRTSNPTDESTSHKIEFNIIFQSMSRSPKWSAAFKFLADTLYTFSISVMYTTYSAYFILFDLITEITLSEKYRLLIWI